MTNSLSLLWFVFISSSMFAGETPRSVTAGAIVNTWSQAGLRVTDKVFDLAVHGNGFFVLQLPSGEQTFSRYGEMGLSSRGFLIQTSSQGKVLGYCGNSELQSINLSEFAKDNKGSVAKSFRIELNGSITAFYASGYAHQTCTVALALFNNPKKLARNNHALRATPESGAAFIGMPQDEGRGSIYGATLEELDEQMYRLNIKSGQVDRVAEEIAKQRAANEQWSKQKTLFYIYELNVMRLELSAIEKSAETCGAAIKSVVDMIERLPNKMSNDEFALKINAALDQHESEVLDILGQERLEKAKNFRENFNKQVWEKFGTSLRFTAY